MASFVEARGRAVDFVRAAARGDRVAPRPAGLLRPARVGDGLPRRGGRHPPRAGAAAARAGRHRRGRRAPPDRVQPLRRVPLLHAGCPAPQRAPADARVPGGPRAARLPARRHGHLQVGDQALTAGAERPHDGLLRPGQADPPARHAGLALRPLRATASSRCRSRRRPARRHTSSDSERSPSAPTPCASGSSRCSHVGSAERHSGLGPDHDRT